MPQKKEEFKRADVAYFTHSSKFYCEMCPENLKCNSTEKQDGKKNIFDLGDGYVTKLTITHRIITAFHISP